MLFKLMETSKLVLLLLAINLASDDGNKGKKLGIATAHFFSKGLWLEICETAQNNHLCSSVR